MCLSLSCLLTKIQIVRKHYLGRCFLKEDDLRQSNAESLKVIFFNLCMLGKEKDCKIRKETKNCNTGNKVW